MSSTVLLEKYNFLFFKLKRLPSGREVSTSVTPQSLLKETTVEKERGFQQ